MESATNEKSLYRRMEYLTSRWWFYVALSVVPAILPPLTAAGFRYWSDLGGFIGRVSEAMYVKKLEYASLMPLLHLVVVFLILLLGSYKTKFGRLFSFLVGVNILVMIFMQTYVVTNSFGLVVITELLTWYIVVLLFWLWEAVAGKTKYTFRNLRRNNLWLIPLAIIAFWDPEVSWSFDLTYFWKSYAPTAFCMMAPIYLALMVFQFPHVNLPLFRVTSFTGIILSVVTIGIGFFNDLSYAVYWILLHIPLIVVSLYCFRMSMQHSIQESICAEASPAARTVID